jgi:pilus assembly protein CpaC
VSALDFVNGLVFQGFNIPGLSVRRVHTDIELASGQSFAIGGLLDRRLTETIEKVPVLADIPILGRIFRSRSLNNANSELLVIVTPEIVRPIPQGGALPQVEFPKPLPGSDKEMRTPGVAVTGAGEPVPPQPAIPVERLLESMRQAEQTMAESGASGGLANSSWQPQTALPGAAASGSPSAAPAARPAKQP